MDLVNICSWKGDRMRIPDDPAFVFTFLITSDPCELKNILANMIYLYLWQKRRCSSKNCTEEKECALYAFSILRHAASWSECQSSLKMFELSWTMQQFLRVRNLANADFEYFHNR